MPGNFSISGNLGVRHAKNSKWIRPTNQVYPVTNTLKKILNVGQSEWKGTPTTNKPRTLLPKQCGNRKWDKNTEYAKTRMGKEQAM